MEHDYFQTAGVIALQAGKRISDLHSDILKQLQFSPLLAQF